MRKFGYCRVSTEKQAKKDERGEYVGSLKIQREAIMQKGVTESRIIIDVASGKNFNRKGIDELLVKMESGDELFVYRLDRLGRDTQEMLAFLEEFKAKNIAVHFIGEGLSSIGSMGEMVITIFSAVAQAERRRMLERTEEGRLEAKSRGVQFGRKKSIADEKVIELLDQGMQKSQIARDLNISRQSVYKIEKGRQKWLEQQSKND